MRLTNVARMTLPSGRLLSLETPATRLPAGLPVSFDQDRHVGAGTRPGSWIAIAFRMPAPVSLDAIAEAWSAVVARHGTLRSVFTVGADGALLLHEAEIGDGVWRDHPIAPDRAARDVVREILDAACSAFEAPSHRVVLVEPDGEDRRPAIVIGADHAHVDMWSLLVLVRDLVACLEDLEAGLPPGAALPPAAAFAEHTALLAAMPPSPEHVHRRWAEILDAEGGVMPRFPLPLGDVDELRAEVVEVRDVLDVASTRVFEERARSLGIRPIALAMSALTAVTRDLAGSALRAVFPVHSRHDARWHDSVGWFVTNAVFESSDPDPAATATAVKEAIALGAHPLAPILAPYGGMPQPPGMFAISWLDTRRLPVALADGLEIQHVSAVIRTDGVMVWFIINDTGLHLRCRYPDTAEARAHVGGWLDAVESALRAAADL